MTSNRFTLASFVALVCWSPVAPAGDAAYALRNANLFNGVDDGIQPNVTVLVRDGRIEGIT